jgi:hypothetical protein
MRRDGLAYLAIGLIGWLLMIYIGGPTGSEAIRLFGPIEFDPVWVPVAGSGVALAYGAFVLLRPYAVDRAAAK